MSVVDIGIHGVRTGTHGMGVITPSFAAVAAATSGFESVEHISNVGILSIKQFVMVAAGRPLTMTFVSSGI